MLYTSTVHEGTLALLRELMQIPELGVFSLVGGTALALKFGHRISEDIDLFTESDFDKPEVYKTLQTHFGDRLYYEERGNPLGIFCYINDIKVDLVKHKHPLLYPVIVEEGIRMYADRDIMAMKVATVLRRAKKKDFWDISELLDPYSVDDFVKSFYQKFRDQLLLISIPQAMTYFADAEADDNPISLKGQTWESVKNNIKQHVNNYLK